MSCSYSCTARSAPTATSGWCAAVSLDMLSPLRASLLWHLNLILAWLLVAEPMTAVRQAAHGMASHTGLQCIELTCLAWFPSFSMLVARAGGRSECGKELPGQRDEASCRAQEAAGGAHDRCNARHHPRYTSHYATMLLTILLQGPQEDLYPQ